MDGKRHPVWPYIHNRTKVHKQSIELASQVLWVAEFVKSLSI